MTTPADPAPVARMYPTARPSTAPPNVPLGTDFTEHYAAGGYPDFESAGLDLAAGQRMAARTTENRAQLTSGNPAADGPVMAPNASQGPAAAPIATAPVQP